jgi:hypothetical protein
VSASSLSMTAIAAAGLVLLAAACGGSPASAVARIGSTATRRSPPEANGAVAFSRCMRAHGVPAYPDPSSNGLLPKKTPQQLGVGSSQLQSAQRACIHLDPSRDRPTQAQVEQYRDAMLAYARCMRAHGVSNMPDPDSRGHLAIGPGTGVAVNSPRFRAAFRACGSKLSP